MTTLQKIKEIAGRNDYSPGMKISKILDLCNQEPEQPKIKIPEAKPLSPINYGEHQTEEQRSWEDLSEIEQSYLYEIFSQDSDVKLCYEFILSLATKPKERIIYVCWEDRCKAIDYYFDTRPKGWTYCIKTTNTKIKEIGIFVEDWQKAVERGEV